MIKRIILESLLFISVISFPWWISVLFALVILFYLKTFNEIILFGLIMDIYYGRLSPTFHVMDYKITIVFIIALLVSFFIKKRLKFYLR